MAAVGIVRTVVDVNDMRLIEISAEVLPSMAVSPSACDALQLGSSVQVREVDVQVGPGAARNAGEMRS